MNFKLSDLFKSKKQVAKERAAAEDLKKRAHFARPQRSQTTKEFVVGSDETLRRAGPGHDDGLAFDTGDDDALYDPDQYRSVHGDAYRQGGRETFLDKSKPEDAFVVLDGLDEFQQKEAFEDASIKTQLRIVRANSRKEKPMDPSQVNMYHRRAAQTNDLRSTFQPKSQGFGDDFVSEQQLRETDHLDLIGADRDFLDKDMEQQAKKDFDEVYGGFMDNLGYGRRRTSAFNEYVPIQDADDNSPKFAPQDEKKSIKKVVDDTIGSFEFDEDDDKMPNDEEEATRQLAAELRDQAKAQDETLQNKKTLKKPTSFDMEVDDDQDDDEEAKDMVVGLEPKQKNNAGFFSDMPGIERARAQSSADFAASFVPKRLSKQEANWKREQDKHLRMKQLASGQDDEDFFKMAGSRKESFIQSRRLGQAKKARRLSNDGVNGESEQLSAMRDRAQSVIDSMEFQSKFIAGLARRERQELQIDEAQKQSPQTEEEQKHEKELVHRYKEILENQIESGEFFPVKQKHIKNPATEAEAEIEQYTQEEEEQMRLEFYRQMNVFEFDDKHGSPNDTDQSKEDSKIEEIRRTIKRPTFGQSRLESKNEEKPARPSRYGDRSTIRRHQSYYDKLSAMKTLESTDMINFIDWNERRHRVIAQQTLRKNTKAAREKMQGAEKTMAQQHRLTAEQRLKSISMSLASQRQKGGGPKMEDLFLGVPSAIAVTEELILVGTKLGQVLMYDRDTQEFYGCFQEKSKEFADNAVTVLDVHPTRTDSVLVGYQFGQMLLFETTNFSRPIKVIREHHKGATVANMAFLDWDSGKEERCEQRLRELVGKPFKYQEQTGNSWLFASVDSVGRILITSIYKQFFQWQASKQPLPIELKRNESKFYSLSARFASDLNPQEGVNDYYTLLAVANTHRVLIYSVGASQASLLKEISAPLFYDSPWATQTKELQGSYPTMSWGFGHTPIFKDRTYAVLAIAWGPLVQLTTYLDIMDDTGQIFYDDGFVILRSSREANPHAAMQRAPSGSLSLRVTDQLLGQMNPFAQQSAFAAMEKSAGQGKGTTSFERLEQHVERIFWVSDSHILLLTRKLELKLFYTQKFKYGRYQPEDSKPSVEEEPPMQEVGDDHFAVVSQNMQPKESLATESLFEVREAAPRSSMHTANAQAPDAQVDGGLWVSELQESPFGQAFAQTLSLFNGMLVALGTKNVLTFLHLRWDEGLEEYKAKLESDDWMLVFARAIDIYVGKIKGYAGVPENMNMRQEIMKGELKVLITGIINEQLEKWTKERRRALGKPEPQPKVEPVPVKEEKKVAPPKQEDNELDFNPFADPDNPFLADNPYAMAQAMERAKSVNKNPQLDETSVDILSSLRTLESDDIDDAMSRNLRLLIRTIIEFCVTVEDYNFLFYDVFLPFQEQNLSGVFYDELKPFILAGRLSTYSLGLELQSALLDHYKATPEVFEKVLINLSLTETPRDSVDELISFCKDRRLTTGLIYLHMQTRDTATVLFMQLLEIYRHQDLKGTVEEVISLKDLDEGSVERSTVESSQKYLGAKILWALRMFMNGRSFPNGTLIPQTKWSQNVTELAALVSNQNVMPDLLIIDAAAYFQIVSLMFLNGKVFEFIQRNNERAKNRVRMQQNVVPNSIITADVYEDKMVELSHEQILQRFDKVCQPRESEGHFVREDIRMQYLYFVANVASKAQIKQEPQYYLSIMLELLSSASEFLKFNRRLIGSVHTERALHMTENALMELMQLCEPLTDEQIDQLLEKCDLFNHLKVALLNKKEEFVQCLEIFVNSHFKDYQSSQKAARRVFDFVNDKMEAFQRAKRGEGGVEGNREFVIAKEDLFRRQIFTYFGALVNIDAEQSHQMVDRWFGNEHTRFIESLGEGEDANLDAQFLYLDSMFERNSEQINELINMNLHSALKKVEDKEKAEEYMKMQKIHFRLLCKKNPAGVLDKVRLVKKGKLLMSPAECLELCIGAKQTEACAILANHMQSYLLAVTYYMSLLTDRHARIDYAKLLSQLAAAFKRDGKVPQFVPYPEKAVSKRTKEVVAAEVNGNYEKITSEEMSLTCVYAFDHVIRKAVKISEKESMEKAKTASAADEAFDDPEEASKAKETAFADIDKIWFFVLNNILKIKEEQTAVLDKLIGQKQASLELIKKSDRFNQGDAGKKASQINKAIKGFQDMRNIFEEFYKQRLDFVIERSLNEIELKKLLDDMVQHDEEIKFVELEALVSTIFRENTTELTVMQRANMANMSQIQVAMSNQMNLRSFGFSLETFRCVHCQQFLDEEIRDENKRKQLERAARPKGTMITRQTAVNQYAFESKDQDLSDQEDTSHQFSTTYDESRKLTIFSCGHAYHRSCLAQLVQERLMEEDKKKKQTKTPATIKMLDDQECPKCFSDKKKIDFAVLNQQEKKANTVSKRQEALSKKRLSKDSDEMLDGSSSEQTIESLASQRQQRSRKDVSPSVIKRQIMSAREQQLAAFDHCLQAEGVTIDNFDKRLWE